jgi:hypothetical protein
VETEPEQVRAVDGEVADPVRLSALVLELPPELLCTRDPLRRNVVRFRGQIGEPVRDEVECERVTVLREKAPRGLRRRVDGVRVGANEVRHVPLQARGIAQTREDRRRDARSDLGVLCEAGSRRLAEIVQQRSQSNLERCAGVGRRLDDGEDVLVERAVEGGLELGDQLQEHPSVPGEPERLGRMRAEEQLRELPHPVGAESAADALRRHEPHRLGVLAHLGQRLLVRVEVVLGDEAEPADEPKRVLAEALG